MQSPNNLNKIKFWIGIFIMPFCVSVFLYLILINLLSLQIPYLNKDIIFYFELLLVFTSFFLWFEKIDDKNKTKKIITEFYQPIFFAGVIIIIMNTTHLFFIPNALQTSLIFTTILSSLIFLNNKNTINKIGLTKNINKKLEIITVFSLVLIGLILRLNQISNLSFWFDESISVLIGQQISDGWGDTFLTGIHYNRAIIYHYFLALFLKLPGDLFFMSRFVNTLFYIPICALLYFWSKKNWGIAAALISLFLYTISSFNIAMFREARFYEFINLIFLIASYFIFDLLYKYIKNNKNQDSPLIPELYIFFRDNILNVFIVFVSGIVLITTSELSAYILYPLILLGAYIWLINRKKLGLLLGIFSFIALLSGLILKYSNSFKISFLLKQPQLPWKAIVPDKPFFDFAVYMANYEYGYFYLLIVLAIPFLILKIRDFKIYYISIMLFSLFAVISFQGYGISTMRYYYILMPFISMLFGALIIKYLSIFKNINKYSYTLFFICILTIFINCSYFTILESNSIKSKNSMIDVKNNNSIAEMNFIKENIDIETSIVVSDLFSSIPYYLFFNKKPDYILAEDKKIESLIDNKDIYLGMPTLSYLNLSTQNKKTYLILWYSPAYTIDELMPYLDTNATLIYKEDAKRIFLIN